MQITYEADHWRSAAYDGERRVGVAEFDVQDGRWSITHTEVDPTYGGQGIARKLIEALIEAARRDGAKIVPVCSYAEKMMRGKEAYADVLAD
ncbi:GNAT family N-acetyltransferase [uncultured Selenomonas sp.]|uniref:GNAT family N-acetyltransferase n=1 Tax=uncultured Selenomonas sp. TaxID=159275 RepID=UPI0028EC86F3|nr:GNAT family N-acetyltransferase [uncultured Selenomonas sp.]